LNKRNGTAWTGIIWLKTATSVDIEKEPSVYIKYQEFLEWLRTYTSQKGLFYKD
jgi:hypothetical protein